MGSSGSGKLIPMSLLGCLDRPTSGDYYFEGVDVAHLSEMELARKPIAAAGRYFFIYFIDRLSWITQHMRWSKSTMSGPKSAQTVIGLFSIEMIYIVFIWLPPVHVAITFHEAAYRYVARFLGDDTSS